MSAWLHRVWVAVVAGGIVTVVVFSIPGRAGEFAGSAAILGGAAVVASSAARAVRRALPADPSAFDAARPRRRDRRRGRWRLPDLLRVEWLLESSQATSLDLHHRLRPRLRELAAVRLSENRRIDLDADPERAAAALGEAAWALLRPDRAEPADRAARGASLEEIRAVVEALERL